MKAILFAAVACMILVDAVVPAFAQNGKTCTTTCSGSASSGGRTCTRSCY